MERLFIVGAGGFGREVHAWARDAFGLWGTERFGGFLDDNPGALDRFETEGDRDWRVVGAPGSFVPAPGDRFLVAVGDPALKKRLVETLSARGAQFATLVHPSAKVGPRVSLGEGCILCPNVVVTADVRIGRWVSLNVATAVGHDARIGDHVQASAFCDLTGRVQLGEGVFLGSRASVLPGVEVGAWARIGAGSVVLRKVKPGSTVFGVPAVELKTEA